MSLPTLCTTPSSLQAPVIMIVDDDFAARLQMRFSLENEGFTVVEAEGGLEAVEYFKKAQVDLIFLDVIICREKDNTIVIHLYSL